MALDMVGQEVNVGDFIVCNGGGRGATKLEIRRVVKTHKNLIWSKPKDSTWAKLTPARCCYVADIIGDNMFSIYPYMINLHNGKTERRDENGFLV